MSYRNKILPLVKDYLKETLKNYKTENKGKMFTCPSCKFNTPTCNILPFSDYVLFCVKEGKKIGNIFDIVRLLEEDKQEYDEEQIIDYLIERFKIKDVVSKSKIVRALEFYKKNNFDLVPVAKNQKIPIEKDWTNKTHTEIKEWKHWLNSDINMGIKTGIRSNITVIDVDQKPIPECIDKVKGDCIIQETNKGFHLFYKYDDSLPKTRLPELKTDIENNGGQVVTFPSSIDGIIRSFNEEECKKELIEMPLELKNVLKKKLSVKSISTFSEKLKEDINKRNFNLSLIGEGDRHNAIMHLGGIFRKELNITETSFVLDIINKHLCNPRMSMSDFNGVIRSLDKYVEFDGAELASKILQYLKIVEEATARDVKEALGFQKARIDKALKYLEREGYLIKIQRMYQIIKRASWKDTFPAFDSEVSFRMPYFYDLAHFQYSDMILLGSKAKMGKTTIAVNMLKSFIRQGLKPYYISLEAGSRFIKTAIHLGLKEGDFFWDFQSDPTKIELEENAITIIDWLLIKDKSQTDVVMKHFVEQLVKTNGFLIIFMQLKENDSWFAPNMVTQFPAFASRYVYDEDDTGVYGKWIVDAVRDPIAKAKGGSIPCKYIWEDKILQRMDEIKEFM